MAWYESIRDAAKIAGIGAQELTDYINSDDPPPTLPVGRSGRQKLVNMEKLKEYLKAREV